MTAARTAALHAAFLLCAGPVAAADRADCLSRRDAEVLDRAPSLCTYEPTTLGWTEDSDDVGFMDFKLSVRYQVFPFPKKDERWATYFAFSGRWAQYLGSRESSPVVAKRLNPKMFYRRWIGSGNYFDFGYNHESNGQSVNSEAKFRQAVSDALSNDGRANAAYDQLSRGWDYFDLVWRTTIDAGGAQAYFVHKRFLTQGLLQGKAEEHGSNFQESDPQGKPRRHVHGLAAMVKKGDIACRWLSPCKLFASYETGYSHIARHSTVRVEGGFKVWDLPLMIWGQSGYGSDLAQYYKKVESVGVAVEIGSF